MRRHLRLLGLFFRSAWAAEMEYRLNFLLATLSSLGGVIGSLFTLNLFYRTGSRLGGWRYEEALLVLGFFLLLEGISASWLQPNLNKIVQYIRQGTLDFVLLKPIDSQFWLSLRNFSPWGLPNQLLGLGVLGYSGWALKFPLSVYLWGILPLTASLLMLYAIWFMLGSLTIWFVKIYNVTEVLRAWMEAGRYPISAYPAGLRLVFTFVLPVAFLTSMPAEWMLSRVGVGWLLAQWLVAMGLFYAARRFWLFALGYYTSASS